jgi:predicted ATPase/DNA-binding CsgD family transcriptional regulator
MGADVSFPSPEQFVADPPPAAWSQHQPISSVPYMDRDRFTAPLPASLTPLIGREREVESICALLRQQSVRLLTLIGPGGVGKTRLALHVADRLREDYANGVRFVALAPIADPALVVPSIGQALGVHDVGDEPVLERCKALLRDQCLLLVLDNFEHVAAAAAVVADLLEGCPSVKVLATSRVHLRLSGEREFPVPPLALPADDLAARNAVIPSEAVVLFVERTQAVKPDFALTEENAPIIADICRRLDGLPLAIELAAARGKVLPPRDLLRRLERRLPLLTGGPLDRPARQRTLHDTIAWSYDLLTPDEQRHFRALAVFAGGRTLEAAETVCGNDALDGVASLVGASLLQMVGGPGSAARFTMLETVREYALNHLVASEEEREIRDRHAAWCIGLAERVWTELLHGPITVTWIDVAEAERDNLRAAMNWLDEVDDAEGMLRLTGTIWPLWMYRGPISEWTMWNQRTLTLRDRVPIEVRARAVHGAATVAEYVGVPRDSDLDAEALALFRELGDDWGVATAIQTGGVRALAAARYAEARDLFERALATFVARGDQDWIALLVHRLGEAAYGERDLDLAQRQFEESLARHQRNDDPWGTAMALDYLGLLATERGDTGVASDCFAASLPFWRRLGFQESGLYWLAHVAALAVGLGQPHTAARLFAAQQTALDRSGATLRLPRRASVDRALEATKAQLGEPPFATAWTAGEALSLDDAILLAEEVLALAKRGAASATPAAGGLTTREREVLSLLAAGRTYPQIAETLFLSPATIRTHVQHVYAKLGVSSRHEAAEYARAHDLC